MIYIKTPEEIQHLRAGGKVLSKILSALEKMVVPGITTEELDDEAIRLMETYGAEPVLLGYHPEFAPRPYPAAICTSVNDVVVHGVPSENPYTLKKGDIISIDTTISFQGMIVDSARTVGVGTIDAESKKLLKVTREACEAGIAIAKKGNTVGDIGHAISSFIQPYGFGVVEELCGHGVGYAVHEEPFVPNFGNAGEGEVLEVGMVIAIEPMVNLGKKAVVFEKDGYTVRTKDGSRSAHFEHTVVITEKGPEVLTR